MVLSLDQGALLIKAIIFDFDGVIAESADIKTEAFKELFADYPQKIDEIVHYHLVNAGISCYHKFRYIHDHILGKDLPKNKEIELGKRFSQIVWQKILNVPFVAGAKEFLDTYKNKYQFFIASGNPEEELHNIIKAKGLQGYFKEIHGSPKKKADIIDKIINNHNFIKDEVVYIGDAQSDRIAAEEAGIIFIERVPNLDLKLSCLWKIKDLVILDEILEKIENLILKRSD